VCSGATSHRDQILAVESFGAGEPTLGTDAVGGAFDAVEGETVVLALSSWRARCGLPTPWRAAGASMRRPR
jgi:hypothetical protein